MQLRRTLLKTLSIGLCWWAIFAVGKVPQSVSWDEASRRFAPGLLEEVLGQPARYRVYGFDYER